ncbi:MAG: DUF2007 domain-containing protein [Armatimonadota bacterium]|nr:DUF2007 domain-containing protein [Armatimonadota bacterium]
MNQQNKESGFVSVYQAPDEITAYLVKGLLEEAGIEVMLSSRQVPWMDGIMIKAEGYWGDILVLEDKQEESLAIIEAYTSGAEKQDEVTEQADEGE